MLEKSKILIGLGLVAAILVSVYGIHSFYIEHEANRINKFRKHAGFYVLTNVLEISEDGSFSGLLSWKPGKKEKEEPTSPVIRDLKFTFTVDG